MQTLGQSFWPLTSKGCSTNELQAPTCPSVNWLNCCCPCWTSVCVIYKDKRRMITDRTSERVRSPLTIFCCCLSRAFRLFQTSLPHHVVRYSLCRQPAVMLVLTASQEQRTWDSVIPNQTQACPLWLSRGEHGLQDHRKAAAFLSSEGREESLHDQSQQEHETTCWQQRWSWCFTSAIAFLRGHTAAPPSPSQKEQK